MLANIDQSITEEEQEDLTAEISFDEIVEGSKRSPARSSPGLDGLPYEIIRILITHPNTSNLAKTVYQEALQLGTFPQSWQQAVVVLLPKKGDLTDLSNWRPITLLNADCKIFTRILNNRVKEVSSLLIQQAQCGFMKGRFIGDHGFALRLIMENAFLNRTQFLGQKIEFAGLMLDNAKAYDRVHPTYLTKVLSKFGFPIIFVNCITSLFFGNSIFVNMNGFLTKPFRQQRGLRQGDTISPILFNFALEPFLQSIIKCKEINGYSLQAVKKEEHRHLHWVPMVPLKILAYADDVLLFLHSKTEYMAFQKCLDTYNRASNSKINKDKSVAFPLHRGEMSSPSGILLKNHIIQDQGMKWQDQRSSGYIEYLGYPLWFSKHQQDLYTNELLGTLEQTASKLTISRQLSFHGRAHLANTLILWTISI